MLLELKIPGWREIRPLIVAVSLFTVFPEHARAETAEPWETVCTIADARIAEPRRDASTELERAAEAWIVRRGQRFEHRLAIMFMPACQTVNAPLPGRTEETASSLRVAPGGLAGYAARNPEAATGYRPALYRLENGKWVEQPSGRFDMLAADGLSGVRLEHKRNEGTLWISDFMSGTEKQISFQVPPARQIWTMFLQSYDPSLGRAVIVWDVNHLFGINLDSGNATELGRPGIWLGGENLRLVPGGWVAWDYGPNRVGDRYNVKWTLPWSKGGFTFDEGDEIDSAAVSPSGRTLAVSIKRERADGNYEGELLVIRTSTGTVIHRQIKWSVDLPPEIPNSASAYHITLPSGNLGFLGEDYLAVSIGPGEHIDVLRIPSK